MIQCQLFKISAIFIPFQCPLGSDERSEVTLHHFDNIFARYGNVVQMTTHPSIIREGSNKMFSENRSRRSSIKISTENDKSLDFDMDSVSNRSRRTGTTASDNIDRSLYRTSIMASRSNSRCLMPITEDGKR